MKKVGYKEILTSVTDRESYAIQKLRHMSADAMIAKLHLNEKGVGDKLESVFAELEDHIDEVLKKVEAELGFEIDYLKEATKSATV